MNVELRDIDDVKPYHANPRANDEAVEAVAKSIQEFGWQQPLVVDLEGVVIVGHTRLKAARQLGLTEVPVHVASNLTPEQAKAYRVTDNQTHNLSDWDEDLLVAEIAGLEALDFDLDLLGFSDKELNRLTEANATAGFTDPDDVPPPPSKPITQPGDLWLLGNHRLLCADSTNRDDVRRLMNGERAILFSTDPPYLVGYDGTNHPHKWNEEDKNKDLVRDLRGELG